MPFSHLASCAQRIDVMNPQGQTLHANLEMQTKVPTSIGAGTSPSTPLRRHAANASIPDLFPKHLYGANIRRQSGVSHYQYRGGEWLTTYQHCGAKRMKRD